MQHKRRRPRGSGSVRPKNGIWYARFQLGGQPVERSLGVPVRKPGTREGLTEAQAYKKLGDLMRQMAPPPEERVTIEQAGAALLWALEDRNRSKSHRETVESHVRVHLVPHFRKTPLDAIGRRDVEQLKRALRAKGRAPKTICNVLSTLYSIFTLAEREGWADENPIRLVDKPEVPESGDIRFLDHGELALLLLNGAPDDPELDERERSWRAIERVLYRAAAETGLRQGELLGLRRVDVDWLAMRIRVRKNYVRGETKLPKGKRPRGVPITDVLARELTLLMDASPYQEDEALVFGHPETGKPLDRSKVRKRYIKALERAKVRRVRFHDLRHTFGTAIAAQGVPERVMQEWGGWRDAKTVRLYADYRPDPQESAWINAAFPSPTTAPLSETNSEQLTEDETA
jgi:integrase